jgi:hypothetical protein
MYNISHNGEYDMSYAETIKSGFKIVHKRWQLIAVQAGMMLFNCIGFFVMVGIPLGIAFIIFGLDLTGLAEIKDLIGLLRNPVELLSKYFWLVLIVATSLLFYILVITTLGLYIFSGSVGMICRALIEPASKFSMRAFFGEARKFFFPVMWFTLFVGAVFIMITFILGLFGGGIASLVSAAKSQDSTLALFLGIFFSLALALLGLGVILITLAVTVYGIAVLFFRGVGAIKSFKEAFLFLWNHQNAFWLYVVLVVGYILASFVIMLVVYPFNLIPIIGTIISFPFYVVQGYLGLVIIASILTRYYETEVRRSGAETAPQPLTQAPDEGSTGTEDISAPQAPAQERPHPGTEEKEQG